MDIYEMPIVYLQTHTGCTHSCKICPHREARREMPQEAMSIATLEKVLEHAKDVPEFIVGLQNEPLQDSGLFEKLALIKKIRPEAKLIVETSAIDLTISDAVKLRDAGVNTVRINVWDSPIPARVRHFHYLGLAVELIVVVNSARRFNHDRLHEMYGDKCIITEVPVHNGRGFVRDFESLNSRELAEFRNPCDRLFKELCIAADGSVIGCQEDYTRQLILGDATKESISSIWNSDKLKEFREVHEKPELELNILLKGTICEHCNYTR